MYKNLVIALGLVLMVGNAHAFNREDGKRMDKRATFEQHKQLMLERIDARKSCVSAANNFEELRTCKMHQRQKTDKS